MTSRFSSLRPPALLALAFLLLGAWSAQGQLVVDCVLKRHLYMINEPVLATVIITNQTGREVTLADTAEGGPWFSFQITGTEGRQVPPRHLDYQLQPLSMQPGETVKRTVNLNELYALGDFGAYHVKSSVYYAEAGKYFSSRIKPLELSDGQVIWKQAVGTPEGVDGDRFRTWSLLTMEESGKKMLYVRLQGQETGTVFGCYNLGRMVDGFAPDAKLDGGNNLAVLHLIGPKTYSLSRVGLAGNLQGQDTYVTPKTQPYLRRQGIALQIVGAVRQEPTVASARPDNVPKLSDRPAGF